MTASPATVLDLRSMAAGNAASAPLSAELLGRLADDLERGGPVAELIGDHPHADEPLFGVRALAGVHWLILSGLAPGLDDHLGGWMTGIGDRGYADRAWQLTVRALLAHPEHTRAALDRPVQQHQPGRSALLLSALAMLGAPKVRLLEIGACAGLNLLVDRYHWYGPDWEWGDTASPVRLTTPQSVHPGKLTIVERAGCDLAPRDPADSADALVLRSFLPPEREVERMELDDAIALAARSEVRVDQADAVEWLADRLARPVADPQVRTVVWHSLMWGYLTPSQQADIEQVLAGAARRMPLARAGFEPHSWTLPPRLQVSVYS
jgi:hypothetical protein